MTNQNAPRVADAHEEEQTASVGSGPLLGVLREIAEEMRSCESQCIHAPKAKAMYASRAEKIEVALVEVASLRELLRKADAALKHHGGMQYTGTWLDRDIAAALSPNNVLAESHENPRKP